METTFTKMVKGSTMEALFHTAPNFNIKSYNATNVSEEDYNTRKKYKFLITIRHAEGTNALTLFQEAIKAHEVKKTTINAWARVGVNLTLEVEGKVTIEKVKKAFEKRLQEMDPGYLYFNFSGESYIPQEQIDPIKFPQLNEDIFI